MRERTNCHAEARRRGEQGFSTKGNEERIRKSLFNPVPITAESHFSVLRSSKYSDSGLTPVKIISSPGAGNV
jgi:hypothetical protein